MNVLPPSWVCVVLQGLGLGRYAATFEAEEVEVRVVHLISAQELAGIGVTDRLHQVGLVRCG